MLHQSLLLEDRRAQKGTAAEECASKKCSGNHGLGLFLSYPRFLSPSFYDNTVMQNGLKLKKSFFRKLRGYLKTTNFDQMLPKIKVKF